MAVTCVVEDISSMMRMGGLPPTSSVGACALEEPQVDVGPQHAGESMDFGSDYGLDKHMIPCAKHKIHARERSDRAEGAEQHRAGK